MIKIVLITVFCFVFAPPMFGQTKTTNPANPQQANTTKTPKKDTPTPIIDATGIINSAAGNKPSGVAGAKSQDPSANANNGASTNKSQDQNPSAKQQNEPVIKSTPVHEDADLSIRIKDVAQFQGVRGNQLIGYGLVVGLNRTGDKTQQNIFTAQTIQNLLLRMGVTVAANALKPENTAAVMVTATLPPFARAGSPIDVTVASIADATSLNGGILVLTMLKGIDGQTYAVAQGSVSVGGYVAGNDANNVSVNHPTVGRVANGASVEREVNFALGGQESLTLVLNEADFTTAHRAEQAINAILGGTLAQAVDSRTIIVAVPPQLRNQMVNYMATIENARLVTDMRAKVVVNERTGTIIVGKNVKISAASISQGTLTVRVSTEFEVSQPAPFSPKGETVVVPNTQVNVDDAQAKTVKINDGATVDEIVRGLRSVGATPRDIINILQALKSAGALQAELEMQ
ncbi:MAG TPA: flagellar basal body P-ring protein FlgI [Blastocatellia bacterium]|nr:flagellar basal body P-ring protein FlgI [Blastocatellia bacterium]